MILTRAITMVAERKLIVSMGGKARNREMPHVQICSNRGLGCVRITKVSDNSVL